MKLNFFIIILFFQAYLNLCEKGKSYKVIFEKFVCENRLFWLEKARIKEVRAIILVTTLYSAILYLTSSKKKYMEDIKMLKFKIEQIEFFLTKYSSEELIRKRNCLIIKLQTLEKRLHKKKKTNILSYKYVEKL